MDSYTPTFIPMIFLAFFLLISSDFTTSSTFPIALPGCEDHCGDVSIPFPFGTKEGCYLNKYFLMTCENSSDGVPPQLFLARSEIPVTDISLGGQYHILYGVGYDCYYQSNDTPEYAGRDMTLGTYPIAFNSTANTFTVIGCDTQATVAGVRSLDQRKYHTGCMSMCSYKDDVLNGSCSGIGCCQTSIPPGAREINIWLGSYNNHLDVLDFNPCSYAFVVEDAAFTFSADYLTRIQKNSSFPVVVDWFVANVSCEEAKTGPTSSSYACKSENSECYNHPEVTGYRCKCKDGYEGNPYLPAPVDGGCQDINECANSTLHNCSTHSSCANTPGSYTCTCNKGYHVDGSEDGTGCIADSKKSYWPIFTGMGVSTVGAILVVLSYCLFSIVLRRKEDRLRVEYFRKNGGFLLQQKLPPKRGGSDGTARIFTVEELEKATNNFGESQIVGQGGFGTVYRGELADKTPVAIKKSKGVDHHQVEQFINEMALLSQISLTSVVKLLGCCLETEVPLLVYEFVNNGTLFQHLHNKINAPKLSWNIRLRIASEIAGALTYLHSVASPPIIHRDIKSANILIDQNYTAKVSDFGISRLVPLDENQVSTIVQGTHGYLDPEYLLTGILTEKSDVYSFGVVLVELLTGKKVFEPDRPEAERFLSKHFRNSLEEDHLIIEVFDQNISRNENIEQMTEVAMIAKKCISEKGEDRPYMKDVAKELDILGIKSGQQFVVHALEIYSTDGEAALLDKQSKGYAASDDPTSSGLHTVPQTIPEHMLFPTAGGR